MKVKLIKDEDFVNYKKSSMFIGLGSCDWKCCKEAHIPITICQNCELAQQKDVEMEIGQIYNRYIQNRFTNAIVIGGLEPLTQFNDIVNLISYFRNRGCMDDFVIYTGYYKDEISNCLNTLSDFKNIVVKFGRFKPNESKHIDNILGVKLISNNQYAEKIS